MGALLLGGTKRYGGSSSDVLYHKKSSTTDKWLPMGLRRVKLPCIIDCLGTYLSMRIEKAKLKHGQDLSVFFSFGPEPILGFQVRVVEIRNYDYHGNTHPDPKQIFLDHASICLQARIVHTPRLSRLLACLATKFKLKSTFLLSK